MVKPALLLIDFINDLAFEEGHRLLQQALPVARQARALKRRFKAAGLPVIYVNDNFDRWRSNFPEVVRHCSRHGATGRELVEILAPETGDHFVLKPLHSGFYGTSLEVLLRHLGVDTLVLTGLATDVCVLFTANDAYMRNFRLFVPHDCAAAVDPQDHRFMMAYMERVLKVDTRSGEALAEIIVSTGDGDSA